MIYQPPQREDRPRGRLTPTREVAVVVVLVAAVLALLFPVAFPGVPLPGLGLPTVVAVAPPTPVSMPAGQHGTGTPVLTPAAGWPPATPAGTLGPALWTPTVDMFLVPTSDPFGATAADLLATSALPTRLPRTRVPWPTDTESYPGLGSATATIAPAATPTTTATPAASFTATVTGTPPTATPTGTATNTPYP